jgi:hypothetical protein
MPLSLENAAQGMRFSRFYHAATHESITKRGLNCEMFEANVASLPKATPFCVPVNTQILWGTRFAYAGL